MYISPFTTSRTFPVRLLPPRLPGRMSGSTWLHSSSVKSLGYRSLLRSYRARFSIVHIGDLSTTQAAPGRLSLYHKRLIPFNMFPNRLLAKATRDAGQSRRLLALAEIYDGGSRTKAARIGGVGLQTIRDWVVRFNARGPEDLIDGKAPGNACKLNDRQRQALVNIVKSGPMPAIHGVVRWRLKDLAMWVWEEFRISLSETTLSRELRALGYRKLSARPRHY